MALAAPDLKRQVQPQPTAAPPVYQPLEEIAGKKRNSINAENQEAIKAWLNHLKPGFFEYLEQKKSDAGISAYVFSRKLWDYLTLYKGELIGQYLDEATWELLFSALGPIGNMMRAAYFKNYSWKMAWQKNLLNPDSIYYYMYALPTRAAFDVLKYPGRAAFAILQKGGAPLLSRVFVPEEKYDPIKGEWVAKVKEEIVFGPLQQAIQASHIAADGLDKAAGTLSLVETNQALSRALTSLKNAKTFSEKQEARWAVDDLVKKVDSTVFKRILGNTARRLRSTERDPISFLVSLIGGAIWDLSAGLVLNIVRKAATTALNLIPGFVTLRAQIMEFFTSNRWLNTARIGGATSQAFFRGVFSPTTAASGYLGYGLAGGSPLLQAVFTPTFAGLGAFYNIGLKMAANPQLINWLNAYDDLVLKASDPGLSIAEQNYYRVQLDKNFLGTANKFLNFGPGPLTRFAGWLNRNWLVRIPINGLAARSLMLNLLPANVLASQFLGLPLSTWANYLPAIDYFWQIKGKLFEKFIQKWTQPTWNILGRQVLTPYFRVFSLQNPASLAFRVRGFFGNWFYERSFGTDVLTQRRWFSFFNRNIKPFAQNAFNPGFFMGFGVSQLLIGAGWNPVAAYIVGPVVGSLGWNAAAFALEKTFGFRVASMAKINAWGWSGFIVGSIAQLIFPALPSWFGLATALAFPLAGMIFSALNISLTNLLAAAIAPIYTAVTGLTLSAGVFAGWMAGWATLMSIASVATLTVFAAYAVYAGFWVPLVEQATAGPESSNFSITTDVNPIGPNQFQLCSSFNITEELFNTARYLNHEFDFRGTQLNVDLSDPAQTTSAFRRLPANPELALTYTPFNPNLNSSQYSVALPAVPPDIVGGNQMEQVLVTLLSVPYDVPGSLLDLVRQYPSLTQAIRPYLEAIQQQAKDELNQTDYLLTEAEAQRDLARGQKSFLDRLSPKYSPSGNINIIMANLRTVAGLSTNNPLDDPGAITCDPSDSRCTQHKSTMTSLYNSWDGFINQHLARVELFLSQTQTISQLAQDDPLRQTQFDNLVSQLKTAQTSVDEQRDNLNQQIDIMNDLINQIKDISLSDEDAQFIIGLNLFQLNQLSDTDWDHLSQILKDNFGDIFGGSKYYYVPKGSNYKVCVDADYQGPPGESQTVCSTINAQQNPWVYGTAFATHCTTFTPQ